MEVDTGVEVGEDRVGHGDSERGTSCLGDDFGRGDANVNEDG